MSQDISIDGIRFIIPSLQSGGYHVGIRPWKGKYDKEHFIIKTVGDTYSEDDFSFPHTPIVIDEVFDHRKFSANNSIRVLDMPIKLPKSNDYCIPKILNQFDEVISKIVSFESHINPNTDLYYAYITVDQCNVSAGKTQRRPGCHCNGLQTGIYRRPISRSYVICDSIPDIYYAQGFDTSYLDESTDNFFLAFDDQAAPRHAITFNPYSILLTNSFTVNKADVSNKTVHRTYLRITFDLKMYNRLGNTHNPQLDYKWNMLPNCIQGKLKYKKR